MLTDELYALSNAHSACFDYFLRKLFFGVNIFNIYLLYLFLQCMRPDDATHVYIFCCKCLGFYFHLFLIMIMNMDYETKRKEAKNN